MPQKKYPVFLEKERGVRGERENFFFRKKEVFPLSPVILFFTPPLPENRCA